MREYNAWPLMKRLNKDNFLWGETVTKAFKRLKKVMTMVLVLALSKFSQIFMVDIDASSIDWGCSCRIRGPQLTLARY